jgi:DNA-directed RNA polymerase specialized sigma24 family protein
VREQLPDFHLLDVWAALSTLTELERETVIDHYWLHRPPNEIAAERGVSDKAVRQLLTKGRDKMLPYLTRSTPVPFRAPTAAS